MTMMMRRKSTLAVIESCATGVTASSKSQMDFAHAGPATKRKKMIPDDSARCVAAFPVAPRLAVPDHLSTPKEQMNHFSMAFPSRIAASDSFMAWSPPRLFQFLDLLKPPALPMKHTRRKFPRQASRQFKPAIPVRVSRQHLFFAHFAVVSRQ